MKLNNRKKKRIEYTDEKINKLVFELYGLNEEEVGIVEGVWTKIYKIEGWYDKRVANLPKVGNPDDLRTFKKTKWTDQAFLKDS